MFLTYEFLYNNHLGMGQSKTTEIVGGNVRKIRKRRKLTQEILSERSGISQSGISGIEVAINDSLNADVLIALAKGLGVSIVDLLNPNLTFPLSVNIAEDFASSPWGKIINISDEEIEWLSQIPTSLLSEPPPTMDHIAELVKWRRRKAVEAADCDK